MDEPSRKRDAVTTRGHADRAYVPAAGTSWLLPLYDIVLRWTRLEQVKQALIDQGAIGPRHRVLDVGCGTGSFVASMKLQHPEAEFAALDPDPKTLGRARAKAEAAGVAIDFTQGFAQELPYAEASFDRVFSSFMFHHLQRADKHAMLRESLRVLKPQGELHLLDFAPAAKRADGFFARLLHGNSELAENAAGQIATYLSEAGFREVRETRLAQTRFGQVGFYTGRKS